MYHGGVEPSQIHNDRNEWCFKIERKTTRERVLTRWIQEIDDTVGIMRENIDKVARR